MTKKPSPSQMCKSLLAAETLLADGEDIRQSVVQLSRSIESLEFEVEQLRRMVFGRKSEKVPHQNQNQLKLGFMEEVAPVTPPDRKVTITYERRQKKKKLPEYEGRFPAHLPREDGGVIELSSQERACPDCGTEREVVATEVSERLSYKHHVNFVVKQYHRPVCRCPQCKDGIVQAPAPKTPLEGVQVESSFLAHVTSEKYEFGLPFYRIEDRLLSQGVPMTRTTLCEYQNKVGKLLQPLEEALLWSLKESDYNSRLRKGTG